MAAWLSNQSANSATSPYTVKLNVSSLGGNSDNYGTAGRALRDNSTKYINLDLSGSTFTSIEKEAFRYCASLISVTFEGTIASGNFGENNSAFPGDLVSKYLAGGSGTYKTTSTNIYGNSIWTKQ